MADSLQSSEQGLQRIDQARRKKGWNRDASAWIDAANDLLEASGGNISRSTLQRFWRGIPIRQENFVAICKAVGIEDWESIVSSSTESPSVSASLDLVSDSTWVERTDLIDSLLPVLRGQCRILVLSGITGIGKTVLAERLIIPLQDGRSLCSLNLDDGGVGADFVSSGAALLRTLGEEPTLEDQKDPSNLLSHLLNLLRSNSYRIQIDSLERLLEGNELEGWSDFCDPLWLDLLQQLLAGGECQSQIILTTQDVPGALEEIGSRYERFWHCQAIRGLDETEQLQLFEKRGLPVEGEAGDYLRRIGKLYEGHPLVLRVIAEDLKACGGDVKRYWQQCRFDELEEHRPVKLSRRKLQLEVKQRVKASLERLPEDARQLLCRASVYRRPVPERFWLAMLSERTETQQEVAVNLLKARAFAEEDWEPNAWLGEEMLLRQHNLIRSVAYELLKVNEANWETAERKAAEMWLAAYEPAPNVPNLEKVRGYLEAFDHLFEVQAWNQAKAVAWAQLNTPTKENLCFQIGTWGCYREQVQLYRKLLKLYRKVGDCQGEGITLGNLGIAYKNLGNYEQAIDCQRQALVISREIDDRRGEVSDLTNIGNLYHILGKNQEAIEYQQQCLTLIREIGDRRAEGKILGSIGLAYDGLQQHEYALKCHEQHLTIARETDDRQGEANALGSLGNTYCFLGNAQQATEYQQQRLIISREIGDRRGEGNALSSLGMCSGRLGEHLEELDYHQQHLEIAREVGDQQGMGNALGNLGATLIELERCPEAIENLELAANIFNTIGSWASEAQVCKHLAELHQKTGEFKLAREYCDRALALAVELNIPLAEECRKLREELEATENSAA